MKKYEYLSQLEKLLAALPEAERRDALNYYEEYFDAAGTENEDATAAELGNPADAARKILEGEGLTLDEAAPTEPPLTPPAAPELPAEPAPPTPAKRGPQAKTMWLIFAVVVVAALLIQLAVLVFGFAKPSGGTASMTIAEEEPATEYAATEGSNTPQAAEATTAGGTGTSENMDFTTALTGVKSMTFDIDYGTVTVIADKNAAEPTLSCTHLKQDWFTFTNTGDYDTSPVYVAYKVPSGFKLDSDLGYEPQFTLTVPAKDFAFDALDITVDMGDVKFRGGITADTMNITVSMGNFSGQTVTAKEFSADVDMGNFDLDKLNGAQTTNINVNMGNIGLTVDGSAADYDFDMTTDMGNVAFNGLEQGEAYHAKSTQSHPRSLTLAADMGDVVLTTEKR